MPIKNYGVLKGKAFKSLRANSASEHFQILINEESDPHRIAINTKSSEAPSQVLYFASDNYKHEITEALATSDLEDGFTPLPSQPGGLAIDFIRRNLFDLNEMVPLPSRLPGDNDDLNDKLDFIVSQAINDPSAVVYAFGQHWVDTKPDKYFTELDPSIGIHDIHLNQGNPKGKYFGDNGTWQDGGLLFHFVSRNRWAAVFTAFQSQARHTDDQTGNPVAEVPSTNHHDQPEEKKPVRIVAAMVNPKNDDQGKEYIILLNKSNVTIDLKGWQILDKLKKRDVLTNVKIEAGSTLKIKLNGNGAQLGNKGGLITLLDDSGLKIDGVSYTKKQASREQQLVEL